MRIVKVPRINALGLKGPEDAPDKIVAELGVDAEEISVDNSNVEDSEKVIYDRAKELFESVLAHPKLRYAQSHPNGRASLADLSKTSEKSRDSGNKIAFIGGDHSTTYPIFKAFSEVNGDAFLVVFDAHADCDVANKEPTHEEFLRAIIERGFDPGRVVLVGVRKMWDVEKKFLEENGVKVFGLGDCSEDPIRSSSIGASCADLELRDDAPRSRSRLSKSSPTQDGRASPANNESSAKKFCEGVLDYLKKSAIGRKVYVSVDIDVLDPSIAPGVSYAETEGLGEEEFSGLLKEIFSELDVRTMDVVEVVPEKDDGRTVAAAARVVREFSSDSL